MGDGGLEGWRDWPSSFLCALRHHFSWLCGTSLVSFGLPPLQIKQDENECRLSCKRGGGEVGSGNVHKLHICIWVLSSGSKGKLQWPGNHFVCWHSAVNSEMIRGDWGRILIHQAPLKWDTMEGRGWTKVLHCWLNIWYRHNFDLY